jgi:hypothetical protein
MFVEQTIENDWMIGYENKKKNCFLKDWSNGLKTKLTITLIDFVDVG